MMYRMHTFMNRSKNDPLVSTVNRRTKREGQKALAATEPNHRHHDFASFFFPNVSYRLDRLLRPDRLSPVVAPCRLRTKPRSRHLASTAADYFTERPLGPISRGRHGRTRRHQPHVVVRHATHRLQLLPVQRFSYFSRNNL